MNKVKYLNISCKIIWNFQSNNKLKSNYKHYSFFISNIIISKIIIPNILFI